MDWTNKTILVTGMTGSFGSNFAKYLLNKPVKKAICYSRGWLTQKNLRDELGNPPNFRWFIGDIRDKERLVRALKDVDIVVHTAAIKDLPSCEYNPDETMKTNVQGTQNVIDACLERKVGKCLFISTDKAVNPVNTYGCSKAMAERLWLNANKYSANDDIRFSVCRYGNVCGSAGSIVPCWKKLIADGAIELPITDERMTRFWFSMQDAVSFVVDSLDKMQGGEIFIPTLPSVRITDLAVAFGLPYKVVGIREGEKLAETMGQYRADGTLIDSGNNEWFLSVEEIKKTI
jgi:UDP-N-acetylglucosamine 4,6-dehydratase